MLQGTVVIEDGDFHDGDATEDDVVGPLVDGEEIGADGAGLARRHATRRRQDAQFQVELLVRLVLVVVDDLDRHLALADVGLKHQHCPSHADPRHHVNVFDSTIG